MSSDKIFLDPGTLRIIPIANQHDQPNPLPPLGPLTALPVHAEGLKEWKILILVTAINSFSQRIITYLKYLGFTNISVVIATNKAVMVSAAERFEPDLVICPFLTAIIPDTIYTSYITLVVHPGPPGDAGPSSLDWVLLGDTGSHADPADALHSVMATSHDDMSPKERQRTHWGTIVFQANEELDGGSVWAWEQYPLPPLGSITKASLYQNQHSAGAITALTHALIRVYTATSLLERPNRVRAKPQAGWQRLSVTAQQPFQGGVTHERPVLPPKSRKPDWTIHSAGDILRIVNASDSQPGAQLSPLTAGSTTSLFIYGAHTHLDARMIPPTLYLALGYDRFEDIPPGTPIATRSGAVLFKTRMSNGPVAIWLTHGRVPKKLGHALGPKIPLVSAIKAAGHGYFLKGVQEWEQGGFDEVEGTWQEVFVRTIDQDGQLAQLVYWDFYNGAFATEQCKLLLRALQWANAPERGNVKILALMGGAYFSNGIALNTIENATDSGTETWNNINAIDDIVEFLVSDTHAERSPFMRDQTPLCERGIVTMACLRGNAAAGGVALAAACDVVVAARGVILNPAYRGMGLHGSEFHSFSYLQRCGQEAAASMLRDMLPQSSLQSCNTGLVDIEVGGPLQTRSETHNLFIEEIRKVLAGTADPNISCAPWCRPATSFGSLVDGMCQSKRAAYSTRATPLLHYRNEELSQMILDCKHPIRSKRYHTRRYAFIRKIKNDGTKTPSRYLGVLASEPDEEERALFDDAPGWIRGEEWGWVGLAAPESMASSSWTRIPLYGSPPPSGLGVNESPRTTDAADTSPSIDSVESGSYPSTPLTNHLSGSIAGHHMQSSGAPVTFDRDEVPKVRPQGLGIMSGGMAFTYEKPVVKDEDQVEFPCLYGGVE